MKQIKQILREGESLILKTKFKFPFKHVSDQSHFRDRFFILVICIDYSLELNLAIYQNSFSF